MTAEQIPATTSPHSGKPASARSRSLGGCETCRRRHAKCDETRPSCRMCERAGLVCEQYGIRLLFDSGESHGSRCRRPLFTEHCRQQMSEQLVASLNPHNVNTVLSRLDGDCEERDGAPPTQSFFTQLGPFGAFRLVPSEPDPSPVLIDTLPADSELPLVGIPPETGLDLALEDAFASDPLLDCLFGNLDVDGLGDLSTQNFFSAAMPLSEGDDFSPSQSLASGLLMGPSTSSSLGLSSPLLSAPSLRSPPTVTNRAPPDAPFLLSVYKHDVVPLFSLIQSRKNPWETLFVSSAMETLARLTMGESVASTQMTIFSAILAAGAFAQRGASATRSSANYWGGQAEALAAEAQTHLKRALRDASSTVKKVKYKDTLIALLCIHTVSAYQGSEERVRRCLLDCENWVRFRGLPKPRKSRKVRLLHHCYVYLRIFHESTSVLPPVPTDGEIDHASPEATVGSIASSRSFRLRQWEGRLDQRMEELKEPHQGENDLHLEIPGRWDSTMYPQVFGLLEPPFFLLSQVTRLGNERDLADAGSSGSTLDFKQFNARARSLERCISAWRPPPLAVDVNGTSDAIERGNSRRSSQLSSVLHKALLIFFYRRIYDVDPMILQDKAWQVREALGEYEEGNEEQAGSSRVAAPFLWAAFIAACEAIDPTLQSWFVRWFESAGQRSSVGVFEHALGAIRLVWERQRQNTGNTASWPQILREEGISLYYI
ncbi:C6 transcription factor [Aspergillus indologenus CBS 114.80]|uniref:C6 transcription factor n=1 Tax=Aspergillus indologenus CBS 114.80 TaxID=1450541 RepID=A0A2V5HUP7_9EURO|nr:C6 transcription factor [Aspergillus indologenus CBS 114.80]